MVPKANSYNAQYPLEKRFNSTLNKYGFHKCDNTSFHKTIQIDINEINILPWLNC